MTKRWAETETDAGLLHHRPGLPARWDVSVVRTWPVVCKVSRRRYARQVRQDLWRGAQSVRGFVPRVLVHAENGHIHITGGGVLLHGRSAAGLPHRLAEILDNPQNRRRWDRFAGAPRGDQCSRRS